MYEFSSKSEIATENTPVVVKPVISGLIMSEGF